MIDPAHMEPSHDLREMMTSLAADKLLGIILFVSVLGIVLWLSFSQTPLYRSEARVLVEPIPVAGRGPRSM